MCYCRFESAVSNSIHSISCVGFFFFVDYVLHSISTISSPDNCVRSGKGEKKIGIIYLKTIISRRQSSKPTFVHRWSSSKKKNNNKDK